MEANRRSVLVLGLRLLVAVALIAGALACGQSSSTPPAPTAPPAAPSNDPPAPPSAPPPAPPEAPPSAPPEAPPTPPPSAPPTPPPSAPPTISGSSAPEDAAYLATARAAAVLLNYNEASFFGGGALRSGFTPDPWPYQLTAGSGLDAIDVTTLNIHDDATRQACTRSYVTRRPDFHFEFAAGSTFALVRFYVVTQNNADATLLINQPDARWRCNDDHGRADWTNPLMPAIDFRNPPSGRYDIWVGSFDASSRNPATLYVTELDANHP